MKTILQFAEPLRPMVADTALLLNNALDAGKVVLLEGGQGHEAFTREALGSERDWSDLLRKPNVPLRLLQADQDPQTPVETVREQMEEFPHLDIRFLTFTGQLLLFARWREVFDEIAAMMVPNR